MMLIGVCHEWGCQLIYVSPEAAGWFSPFTTKTKGDGLHSRVMFVDKPPKVPRRYRKIWKK